MSEVKNAGQGAVTSIADADLVMCVANGVYHPISFENLMAAVRDEIQIGGRNYFAMSNASPGNATKEGYSLKMITADSRGFTLSVGATYSNGTTSSLLYKPISEKGRKSFELNILQGCSQLNIKHSGASRDFGATIPFKETGTFMLSISFDSVTGLLAMSNIMLERGNIATDWTPAPEDIASSSWGGVIGYLPITYNLAWKGGAHESDENACGKACVGSDGHLAFGSLDALDQFIGKLESDISSYPVGDASAAERNRLHPKQCKLVHQRSDSALYYRGYVLGCECAEGRRCAVVIRYNSRHKSAVRVFLPGNKPQEFRRMERSVLPLASRGRTAVVGEYIVTVKPRKEVAV